MTASPYAVAEAGADWLRRQFGIGRADIGIVLGSGWGPAGQAWGQALHTVAMGQVPGFTTPVAPGHAGQVRHYRWGERQVVVLAGRTHLYEGLGVAPVAHGVRTLAALGVRRLCLTNAAGTVHPDWELGQVAVLRDHLNFCGATPLVGARFVDLSQVYDPGLRARALASDPGLREAVYAMFAGPQYETPAEVRAAGLLGADLTGMSTVLEAIAAAEFGLATLALSVVTAHSAAADTIDPAQVVRLAEAAAAHCGPLIQAILSS
jgi:purine-nucleoside phosphorylase